MPKVGFVIRTKNEIRWLPYVIKALNQQTYKDFSITVVDSGSTDGTIEFIKPLPNIKLLEILPENFGYSYALNTGIENTDSEYIGIISGHSLPYSNKWLEYGVHNLDTDSNVACVTGHYTDLPDAPINKRIEGFLNRLKWKRSEHWPWMTNTNSLIRKILWSQYRFDENLAECEDYDWALELMSRGYNVILEPKFSVYHSHYHIKGAETYQERMVKWKKINTQIEQRQRPFSLK